MLYISKVKKYGIALLSYFWYACLFAQTNLYTNALNVIKTKCTPCHYNGGAAPFTLTTYLDIKKHAPTIKYVVTKGVMPPWQADSSYSKFNHNRSLTKEQAVTLIKWIDEGCKKTTKQETIEVDTLPNYKPDTVLLSPTITIYPTEREKTEGYTFFLPIKKGQYIKLVDFLPLTARKYIHHCNFSVFKNDSMNFGSQIYLGGWTNGNTLRPFPAGVGFLSPDKVYLFVEIHFVDVPIETTVQFGIGFRFDSVAPTRPLKLYDAAGINRLPSPTYLPPNKVSTYVVTDTLKDDISLYSIYPHMHVLGKNMVAYAITPNNDTINLIRINRWNFDWQEQYILPKPLILKVGTRVISSFTFDNSRNNPANKFNPTKPILFNGMRSDEEMMNLIFHYTTYIPSDNDMSSWY